MRLRTILLLILLLLLAIPLIGAIGLWSIDGSTYRRLIAERVEKATGRKLTIEGELGAVLALRPTLAVDRVSLANAPWATRPDMVTLDRLELQLDALSLLGGQPKIDRLTLIGPEIHLETGPNGEANWQIAGTGAPARREGPQRPSRGLVPVVRDLLIEDGTLTYRDGRTGGETVLQLASATLQTLQADAPSRLVVEGSLDALPLSIEGQLGPLATALGGGPITANLTGTLAGIDATVKGEVTDPADLALDMAASLRAPDLGGLASFLPDQHLARLGPLDLSAKVKGDRRTISVTDLALQVAESDLAGSGRLVIDGAKPRIEADLTSKRLDLRPFLRDAQAEGQGGGSGKQGDGPLFSPDPLPLAPLRAVDAKLALQVGELQTGRLSLQEVRLDGALDDGRLRLAPLRALVTGRPVTGSLGLDAAGDVPHLALELAADQLDVGALLRELQRTSLLEGSADLRAKLDANGTSPQAMARTLGGQVSFLMADGRLRTELIDRLAPGMRQLLGTLVTGKPADVTSLRCLALAMPIAEGVARPRLVLDSEYSTLVGTGSIDLGKEALDLTVVPRAKVADLNVALPVTVRGPLMAPSFGIDREGAARRVAGLLGAAVFPPEVLGTFAEPGVGGGNDCLTLASDPARSPLPGLGAAIPAEALRDPGKALDAAKGALGKAGQGLLENFLGGR